ncbi:MAG TPA: hypothetical protein VGP72_12005 [Planctomycetota bacterium]|jgi:hypothetical protein
MARAKGETKKKAARVAEGPEAPGLARSLGENIGLLISPVLPLLTFFVVLGGVSFGLWRAAGAVSASNNDHNDHPRGGDLLTEASIRDAVLQKQRPTWIPREDFEQVAALGIFARGHSVFEASLSHALARHYESSPWVERAQIVHLHFPARLELELDWRRPAARVEKIMVLDRNGVVLNLMPDSASVRDIPLIAGVLCSRVDAGSRVREKELLDALALQVVVKETLNAAPGQLKVACLQREPSGNWRVITDRGPQIYWGAFTDDPPMDEPRTREKADLLRRRLCEIKDPSVLEYVKVYCAQAPVKLRGVAAAETTTTPTSTAAASARQTTPPVQSRTRR